MSEQWRKTRNRMGRQWVKDEEMAVRAISKDRGMGCQGLPGNGKKNRLQSENNKESLSD